MPSDRDNLPSIGDLLMDLETARSALLDIARKTSEPFERRICEQAVQVTVVMDGVLVLLRDHLACHDCDEDSDATVGP